MCTAAYACVKRVAVSVENTMIYGVRILRITRWHLAWKISQAYSIVSITENIVINNKFLSIIKKLNREEDRSKFLLRYWISNKIRWYYSILKYRRKDTRDSRKKKKNYKKFSLAGSAIFPVSPSRGWTRGDFRVSFSCRWLPWAS